MRNEQPIGSLDDPHDSVYTLEDYRKDPAFRRRVKVLRPDYALYDPRDDDDPMAAYEQQPGGPGPDVPTFWEHCLAEGFKALMVAITLTCWAGVLVVLVKGDV